MSFRKEEKLHIHKSQLYNLLDWIYENQGYKLHPSRVVSSTYFDNNQMQMFLDSEEGSVPRKKIRIRSYSTENHGLTNSSLEIKTSSVEGRFKTKDKVFNLKKIISIGLFDQDYGVCHPKVRVTYTRDYYKIHNVRLTIDQNIEYKEVTAQGEKLFKRRDPEIIVEIKASDSVSIEYLLNKFHFSRIRFSKYSNAINLCKLSP
jgi:hypothetical protein